MPIPTTPTKFTLDVAEERIVDLRRRLAATAFAPDVANDDWEYGLPTEVLRAWVQGWHDFDWREAESEINEFEHERVVIDGVPVHYMIRRGNGSAPMPLMLVHGFPWTFWDWHETVEQLADPLAHGGLESDDFDIIVPSLPGFTLSTPLEVAPFSFVHMARVLCDLMVKVLGYERFAVAGGDLGLFVTGQLGHAYADHVIGVHMLGTLPLNIFSGPNPIAPAATRDFGFERRADAPPHPVLDAEPRPRRKLGSHLVVHALEPQTLAAAMHDSPAGMAAWILHRRHWWSEDGIDVSDDALRRRLLTSLSLYWFTDCFSSVVRTYRDMVFVSPWTPSHAGQPVVVAPTGITFFDHDEMTGQSRFWCRDYYNVVRISSSERGGHFAPAEAPDVVASEIRETMRLFR